jgi:large subunit ribosomal protein L23
MEILKKPLLTEKVTQLTEKLNRYAFMYGVTVKAVNTMKYVGKLKTRNTKAGAVSGRAATYKKAVITLKDGETIDFYSGI